MGSPKTEAWRSDDETQHTVTVSDFYISPYEVTQQEYTSVMGNNPSNFSDDNLPVENTTWLQAVLFCNALSEKERLTPVYTVDNSNVSWDRSANSYRLPTEKVLIAFFSWGGNTMGIAEEIQAQTGADLFEIELVNPYSENYNTVLEQAQHDQNVQARPEIKNKVENFDQYDTILIGYPNWWASIPMPIASFLETYNCSGKTIIPFCSHGGGRFGQSLTAIAKLAPDAVMGEALSVHYSGGSELSGDIEEWLKLNNII